MSLSELARQLLGECEFAGVCKEKGQYDPRSHVCTKDAGVYYNDGGHAGCYRALQAEKAHKD